MMFKRNPVIALFLSFISSLHASEPPSESKILRPALIQPNVDSADPSMQSLSPERQVIWTQWINQFDSLRASGITRKQIDQFDNASNQEKEAFGLLRVQIIDQKVYSRCYSQLLKVRADLLVEALELVVAMYKIKNLDLVLCINEIVPLFKRKKVDIPMLHPDKKQNDQNIILIPDHYILPSSVEISNWAVLYKQIKAGSLLHPWATKIEKVFWRGKTTGGIYRPSNFSSLPRLSLVKMSKSFPDKVDALFVEPLVYFTQDKKGAKQKRLFYAQSFVGTMVKETDHLSHKYLISLDGNVSAWLRPEWIMASNSVLLFQHQRQQWYYCALKPWVHYVPIKDDVSDIFEKIEWLKNHDEEARKISENANTFIDNAMMPEHLIEDLAFVLNQYASIQRFELTELTLSLTTEVSGLTNKTLFPPPIPAQDLGFDAKNYMKKYPHVVAEALKAGIDPEFYAKKHFKKYKKFFPELSDK